MPLKIQNYFLSVHSLSTIFEFFSSNLCILISTQLTPPQTAISRTNKLTHVNLRFNQNKILVELTLQKLA